MDSFDLSGKLALVTGSSRGLGRVFAEGLGEAGAEVVLNGRHRDTLEQARDELAGGGIRAHTSRFDVTVEEQVNEAVAAVEAGIGPIDILVNNAGINLRGRLEELPTEKWTDLMDVNLNGVFFVTRAVGARMVERGRGKIINICSLMSEGGRPTTAPYAASKGALKMLTRALAVEWGGHDIQVNGIGPGYFLTEMTRHMAEDSEWDRWVKDSSPAARWGDPEELKGPAVFLASDASSFVNGQILYVDGGWLAAL
ncbi:MAG: SDR family oxidoreductase [Planctomycetota bacterium]